MGRRAKKWGRSATWGVALAVGLVLPMVAPHPATAQVGNNADNPEADKISNDNPARPFQLPPASAEVKEALDDFERFGRRGAWERALKSLFSIPEAQTGRFIVRFHMVWEAI